jgi:hypothetical protein
MDSGNIIFSSLFHVKSWTVESQLAQFNMLTSRDAHANDGDVNK